MFDTDLQTRQDEAFREAVLAGLSQTRKTIPCRWLYDARGSGLFDQITRLPEYYLTRAETEILENSAAELADFCGRGALLIEYGAGEGIKSEILISELAAPRLYMPIDIASDVLARATRRMRRRFPDLEIRPLAGDFAEKFDLPADLPAGRRTAFFSGSTIGNLDRDESRAFLRRLRRHAGGNGRAIIGVDLTTDEATLLDAYDDGEGVTAAFNLNLLARINRELDGDFSLDGFYHEARWNPVESAVEMHLVSREAQTVVICGRRFHFRAGETIHTESSRKYDPAAFAKLAETGGWRVAGMWSDRKNRFALFGLEAAAT